MPNSVLTAGESIHQACTYVFYPRPEFGLLANLNADPDNRRMNPEVKIPLIRPDLISIEVQQVLHE